MAEVKSGSAPLWKLAGLVALIAGSALLAATTPLGDYLSREGVGDLIAWLRSSTAAPLVYVAVYAAATALAFPGSILTLAGGAMFGLVWGTVYTTIAANIGANAAFAVARYLGRDGVSRLAGHRLDALDRATSEHGFRGLLTLRLIPAVPFNALNFGSGLTSIRWPTYALATVVGIFPGTVVYTMFADALLTGSQQASREALMRVLLSGALLVFLSFLPALAKRLGIGAPKAVGVLLLGLGSGTAAIPADATAQSLPTHERFTAVLDAVVRQPSVDYEAVVAARGALDAYLDVMAEVRMEDVAAASHDARLAFWINAYNACMLRLVAANYPIQRGGPLFNRLANLVAGRPANSVWQIPDVFTREHCEIAGTLRSQDQIEHEIIRPMGDPRIHFAVNCAAKSCPPLWPEAYTEDGLDAQLDRAVANLLENPEHFTVGADEIRLNKVLDWFRDDFGGIEGLRSFLAAHLDGTAAAAVVDEARSVAFFDYDWTLNDIAR